MSIVNGPVSSNPVIVVVPASFSPPSLYTGLVEALGRHGYETIVIDLPSVGNRRRFSAATMAEDADHIKSLTSKLADEDKEIILVMHSYGGICGTESSKGVTKAERVLSQAKGGIIRLFYISSPVPGVGGSIATQMGENMPEFIKIDGDYMVPEPDGCAQTNFSDLRPEEGVEFARMMLPHSRISFTGTLSHSGYHNVPVSYLVCKEDLAVPPQVQEAVIRQIEAESGRKVDVHTCQAGHFPTISRVEEVSRAIRRAIGEVL
ncbi:hypothetical protein PV08_05675 [Exophiala spinifera]|uniref:AB hydrolase-1 domain-containing protein n=1 Tax=Exophiala spinifera TaxID=91928 RepID=A0A0D1ZS53_9EURO|nr:uncharacterized protein PV08_05675 [Exophiala spinifera]KIW15627.1 hypothetical protein PV08_05675 [Exophiala spinifera]